MALHFKRPERGMKVCWAGVRSLWVVAWKPSPHVDSQRRGGADPALLQSCCRGQVKLNHIHQAIVIQACLAQGSNHSCRCRSIKEQGCQGILKEQSLPQIDPHCPVNASKTWEF
eukprot:3447646-Amphidinium_carterae.3